MNCIHVDHQVASRDALRLGKRQHVAQNDPKCMSFLSLQNEVIPIDTFEPHDGRCRRTEDAYLPAVSAGTTVLAFLTML